MDPYDFILTLIKDAGKLLLEKSKEVFKIATKNNDPRDIVTAVDFEVNNFLINAIKKEFTSHGIYSEESEEKKSTSEFLWVIDPIDGSSNFSRHIPHFAICIGLLHKEIPIAGAVYNPITDELFSFKKRHGAFLNDLPIRVSNINKASDALVLFRIGHNESLWEWGVKTELSFLKSMKKISNFGSSALDLCFLAAGRIDAVVYGTFTTKDVAVAIGILREAEGEIYTPTGLPAPLSKKRQTIIATANKKLFEEIRALSHPELLIPFL